MKPLFANLIPENWLHAIGAALFHSLWIGVILSVVTALFLSLSRKSSSALRYKLLVGCLLLFVIGVASSFVYELNNVAVVAAPVKVVDVVQAQPATVSPAVDADQFGFRIDGIKGLWDTYSVQIVMVWFLIICAKSIHLWVGLSGIAFLKKNQAFDAGKFWELKTIEIGHKLGMSKAIKLVQSGIAKVPMVVGHFKPVILLPLGLINGLSIAEVEAILAHELAHVKRRDYLVNLVQNLLEIVFFFNPAVLWISKLIRTEREHCCDDLALQCVGDKKNYVNALLYCQEFQANSPAYAMALTGGKNQLLNRVKRMLFDTRTSLNRIEKAVLTIALASVFVGSAAFTKVHSAIATGSLGNISFFQDKPQKQQDTTPSKKGKAKPKPKTISKSVTKEHHVVTENGVVIQDLSSQLAVEDQSRYVADSLNYIKHNELFSENQAKYAETQARYLENQANYKKHSQLFKEDQKRYDENNANFKKAQEEYNRQQLRYSGEQQQYEVKQKIYDQRQKIREADKRISDSLRRNINRNIERTEVYRLDSAKRKLAQFSRSRTPQMPLGHDAPATPASPLVPARNNLNRQERTNQPAAPATPARPGSSTSSTSSTSENSTRESITVTDSDLDGKSFSDMVNRQLVKDGIIKSANSLSYRLDGSSFVVNGKKLDAETHQKYKVKYLKKTGTALVYNYEVHSK